MDENETKDDAEVTEATEEAQEVPSDDVMMRTIPEGVDPIAPDRRTEEPPARAAVASTVDDLPASLEAAKLGDVIDDATRRNILANSGEGPPVDATGVQVTEKDRNADAPVVTETTTTTTETNSSDNS